MRRVLPSYPGYLSGGPWRFLAFATQAPQFRPLHLRPHIWQRPVPFQRFLAELFFSPCRLVGGRR